MDTERKQRMNAAIAAV